MTTELTAWRNDGQTEINAKATEARRLSKEEAKEEIMRLAVNARENQPSANRLNTQRAYNQDWVAFAAWCGSLRMESLPASAETVVLYVQHLEEQGRKISTIRRALASISVKHGRAGFDTPTKSRLVQDALKSNRNRLIERNLPTRKKPLTIERLTAVVSPMGHSDIDLRDASLLCLQFGAALRRSEVVALDRADVAFTDQGIDLLLKQSKTDRSGEGIVLSVAYYRDLATCPVRRLQAWIERAGIASGAIFRSCTGHGKLTDTRLSGGDLARIVKRRAEDAGLDAKDFSGHSARAGFCSSGSAKGIEERLLMKQSRHKSATVFRVYVRDEDARKVAAAVAF